MTDELKTAQERQLDVALEEVSGAGPRSDLEQRIVAAVHAAAAGAARTHGAPRRRRLLAAAMVLFGVAVVVAVAALGNGTGPDRAAAPAHDEQGTQDQGKGQGKQTGEAEKRTPDAAIGRVEQLIRDLELPERRTAARREILQIGAAAVPVLRAAMQQELLRGRTDLYATLRGTLFLLSAANAKRRMGLPIDQTVTLFADYSDNLLCLLDGGGKVISVINEVFGAWDAELTNAGTLLVTEFSVSRVSERTLDGKILWTFEDLRNPYDADRLPNGNTLITDTFRGRVIEVAPDKKIVWTFDRDIRPFDADRLPNGNTLIADVLKGRVIEVTPEGKIAWSVQGLPSAHDADRLPNGNTLITLRRQNRVVEVDPQGREVFSINQLNSPSDADRMPDGNTIVAENNMIREFDAKGAVVWQHPATWVVEVNRY